LLDAIAFDPARDRLWFVGDLVNRGPDSAECLRFVKSLGDAAVAVLGNHDLHLLCVAAGVEKKKKRDTLEAILAAPDREPLLDWLRARPLMHVEGNRVLVHAGLLPQWTVDKARALAAEVEAALAAPDHREFLAAMYGDQPTRWDERLRGFDRLRVIVNALTRLRMCDGDGAIVLPFDGGPGDARPSWTPWFDMPRRANADATIVFGHWSALGLMVRDDAVCLDSGCVWGRSLSALRIDDRRLFQVACPRGKAGA
jgi:bis(5'-nucleosyl)-tetraphosphatase (symmetrical)